MSYDNLAQHVQETADRFLATVIFNIGSSISKLKKTQSALERRNFNSKLQVIQNRILNLVCKSTRSQENIFKSLVLGMTDLHHRFESHDNFINVEILLDGLAEMASFLELDIFDIKQVPRRVSQYFYLHLANLTQLKILNLSTTSSLNDLADLENVMVTAVSQMSFLEEFTLHVHCTDKIVANLCKSCQRLDYLDVCHSKAVTGRCIYFLTNFPKLKSVHLNHTGFQISDYLELLMKCPNLRSIGRYYRMNQLLERIKETKPELKLDLEVFEAVGLETKHLILLAQFFPKIKYLDLKLNNADVSVLKILTDIQSLSIKYANFYNVVTLLEKVGPNVRGLHLDTVQNVELMNISYLCPYLRRLVFESCNFSEKAIYDEDSLNHFSSVEVLSCDQSVPLMQLKFLLANCPNIRGLAFTDERGLTDKMLKDIMRINGMTALEELFIINCKQLTVNGLEKIFYSTDRLKKVVGINRCKLITKEDLLRLQRHFPNLAPSFMIEKCDGN